MKDRIHRLLAKMRSSIPGRAGTTPPSAGRQQESEIRQVSDTAFMAAAYRALETRHRHALFQDPLAAKVAGEQGERIIGHLPRRAFLGGWSVVIRTRIIDDFIGLAVDEGVDTVLNLGAGLDTRPYRLELPAELRWIEVDYPHVVDLKEARLAGETARCRLERIGLDLTDTGARRTLLKDVAASSKKILVLTEAVTPYLAQPAVASLGADLLAQTFVQYWLVDYFSPSSYEYRRRSGMSRMMKNAPFLFEPADYFGFFSKVGWTPRETRYFAEEGEKLRRPAPFPLPVRLVMRVMTMLASPTRREQMKQYAGFVLFEPARPPGDHLKALKSR